MQNRPNAYNAVSLGLIDQEPERIQTMLGLFDRDVFAAEGKSMEVFSGGQYVCSLRVSEDGIGSDAAPAETQVKLRNGDMIYYVDLEPRILHLSGALVTKDGYNPGYNAEITIRVNNPSAFLRCYFQALKDYRLDPIIRFTNAVERAFRRYAEAIVHDKVKRKDLESAAFKNHEGRNLGIWIERSVVDIIGDPQRQRIREIEKQTEVEKALERSKAEVQRVRSDYVQIEDSRQKAHSRGERARDTSFDLDEDAKKQAYAYQQKIREVVFSSVHPQWTDYILKELDKVDNSIPEFFSKNPQMLQYYPGLSQLFALPQPRLALDGPSSDKREQNITDMDFNNAQRRRRGGAR